MPKPLLHSFRCNRGFFVYGESLYFIHKVHEVWILQETNPPSVRYTRLCDPNHPMFQLDSRLIQISYTAIVVCLLPEHIFPMLVLVRLWLPSFPSVSPYKIKRAPHGCPLYRTGSKKPRSAKRQPFTSSPGWPPPPDGGTVSDQPSESESARGAAASPQQ